MLGIVATVNLARPQRNTNSDADPDARPRTGIDKVPTADPVEVRAPGPMHGGLGGGLVGDMIGNRKLHGGDDQAVYAYAREDLDTWQTALHREISNGMFGENLTTSGVDVTGARIGDRWAIGTDGLVLEISRPRIPCRTFAAWLAIQGWIKTFTEAALPGAYLRVLQPGRICAGDPISLTYRPDHDVSVALVFRALTREPELLPDILAAPALAEPVREIALRRVTSGD